MKLLEYLMVKCQMDLLEMQLPPTIAIKVHFPDIKQSYEGGRKEERKATALPA